MKNENVLDKLKTVLKFIKDKSNDKTIVSDISLYDITVCSLFIQKIANLSQNSCLKKYADFKIDISVLDVTIEYVHTVDDMDKILDTIIKEKQIKTISDIIPFLNTDVDIDSEEYIMEKSENVKQYLNKI